VTTNTPERPWQRGFWSLIVTQFQGAFSDNALKTVVTFFGLSLALPPFWHKSLLPIATGVFSLPFILF
jgi:acyl-[acyl-carrier-protein]-phospholipid O-acyltransferase/long-chain-fatty-acid--[acyl-carrier-protein] ligase